MMELAYTFMEYLREHLVFLGLFSVVSFLGSLIAIPVIVVHLPESYFINRKMKTEKRSMYACIGRLLVHIIKNVIGAIFFIAGVAMLFLPGQGLITIAIGISLLDFPGKQELLDHFLKAGSVKKTINWMRKKYGKPPLKFNEKSS